MRAFRSLACVIVFVLVTAFGTRLARATAAADAQDEYVYGVPPWDELTYPEFLIINDDRYCSLPSGTDIVTASNYCATNLGGSRQWFRVDLGLDQYGSLAPFGYFPGPGNPIEYNIRCTSIFFGGDSANIRCYKYLSRQAGAPVATDEFANTPVNTPVTIDLTAGAAGSPTSVAVVGTAAGGTVVPSSANDVTFAPNVGFSGVGSFQFTVSNAKGTSNTATVQVIVGGQKQLGAGSDGACGCRLGDPQVGPQGTP